MRVRACVRACVRDCAGPSGEEAFVPKRRWKESKPSEAEQDSPKPAAVAPVLLLVVHTWYIAAMHSFAYTWPSCLIWQWLQ